ncbi:porin family protein [Tamlana sp. 2_MG-2023]|uniref:porin family protein n=1 Tax=unclassified Tamlana TaxID=2614803 RepID=UPI0026E14CB8|nr:MULTISPECIES: porin family protein [unclassified Tamlana]MDO6759904.1 porin family protein [Tamlana sp. 2_MG-2023]MDO6791926.1 porin family protein [Tamlana sp. 1_MG-2023]
MKHIFIILFLLVNFTFCFGQDVAVTEVDSLYKEDHFYVGVTYNFVSNRPEGLEQNGFSWGLNLGYIKDMPINKARNKAIGVGLGYATDAYNHNLLVTKNANGNFEYDILDDGSSYSKNKFSFHLIEVPIEYRWRTSTPTDYAFWRIYAGFKFGYVFSDTSSYKGDLGEYRYTNNKDFNNFQYGLKLSVGYNTWNFHVNYLLNPIFSDKAQLDGGDINMSIIKIGLIFYIL